MPEPEQPKPVVPAASDKNMFAAFSYVWIISLVILLMKRQDEYIAFHAKQGLVLTIISILTWWIPVLGWLISLLTFVGMVVGFLMAWQGKRFQIPLVYQLSLLLKF